MSAAEALKAARAAGIKLAIDGDDLVLEASASPPSAVIDCLTGHKTEIVAMLRSGHDGWSAEDWRLFFEERAAIAEFDGGLPRTEADAQALACCIVEWLNRNPTPSAPGRCAWCGQAESRDAVVLPYGVEPGTHIWPHAECWPAWQDTRRSQAREALARMGIGDLSDGRIVTGGCGHHAGIPALGPTYMQAPDGEVDIIPAQRHQLRGPKPVAVSNQDSRGVPMPSAVLFGGLNERSTSRSVRYSRLRLSTVTFTEVGAASPNRKFYHGNSPLACPYCYRLCERCNRPR
jgi:hypothetical protein